MSAITLHPQLMEQLEQVAAEQAVMPEELVENAVRTYLRQIEREQIKVEIDAFRSMHGMLIEKFLGQYVAIHSGKLVDHDKDFQAIHSRIRQRFGRQPVLLRRVEAEPERVLVFRSPRLERDKMRR
ncbi:MAG: hypothetical protein A2Z04_06420 [Chloroflexi bacterium RBG_16_57_9]|nr:MAG: hypothetical protein A2Z04_06420 [Chloroflexi bacterium RBG_16_57_9]